MFSGEKVIRLQSIVRAASEQYSDLAAGLATVRLDFRLSGSLTVAGAAADTVLDDAIQRLITNIRLEWDQERLIDNVPLRDLYELYLHQVAREPVVTGVTTANLQANATYAFELRFSYFFANPMLVRPWDTHLPVLPTRDALRLFVDWNQSIASASSDPGTAAFTGTGATATLTWAVNPSLEILQVTAPRMAASKPWYLPYTTSRVSKTWAAATSEQVELINTGQRFVFESLRSTYGPNEILQDSINTLTFRDTGDTLFDRVKRQALSGVESQMFPAIRDAANRTGRLGILYAAGGSLNNMIDPNQHTDLRYEFDLASPTSGTGLIRFVTSQVRSVPGITQAQ